MPPEQGHHRSRSRGAEFNLHPRLPDIHEAVADVLERANLTSAKGRYTYDVRIIFDFLYPSPPTFV